MSPSPSAASLLAWYARHRRVLPWRAPPGTTADPYHVWLSEIMLQQTVVAAAAPYFETFRTLYPSVAALAAAPLEDVLGHWAGLGYYARARNLHACAGAVAARGAFPDTVDGLRALPGVGAYTAAAIGAIAFGLPVVPVDGNVERVVSRLFAITTPLPRAKPEITAAAQSFMAQEAARAAPSDFAQALFDLGATLCSPRAPACALCPWRGACAAFAQGIAAGLPVKAAKAARPTRRGRVFVMLDADGRVALRRRAPTGLLGGMLELPGSDWAAGEDTPAPPLDAPWVAAGEVVHGFTHFILVLTVHAARVAALPPALLAEPAATARLPTAMKKALRAGLAALDAGRPRA